ncbi:MAG: hypothetical protein HYY84_09050 [Deltaproteobacteria bacterium]|nr:hypothetical protein [Deltaproteobacteria bacterium]
MRDRIKWPALAVLAIASLVVCSKDEADLSSVTIQLSAYQLAVGGVQKVTVTVTAKDKGGNSMGTSEVMRLSVSTGTLTDLTDSTTGTSLEKNFSSGGTYVAQLACPAAPVVIKLTAFTRYKTAEQFLTCVEDNSVQITLAAGATALSYSTSTQLTTTVTDSSLVSSDGGSNSNNKTITISQNPVAGSFSGAGIPVGAEQTSVDVPLYGGVGSVVVTYTAWNKGDLTTNLTSCIKGSSKCATLNNISIQNGRIVQLSSSISTLTYGSTATLTANVKSGGVGASAVPVKFEMYQNAGTFSVPDGGSGITVTQNTDSQGNAIVSFTAGSTTYASTTLLASIVGGLTSEADTENIGVVEGKTLTLTTPVSLPTSGVGDISLLVTQGSTDGGTPVSTPVTIRFSSTPTDGGGAFSTDGIAAYTATLDKATTQGTGVVTAKYKAGTVEGVQTVKAEIVGSTEQTTKGITITPAAVGSIEFCASDSTTTCGSVKSSPNPLILGVIGSRKPQQAQLYFMVKNELGQAYTDGQSVTFTLSEVSNTGARLVYTTGTTGNGTGLVTTTLTAGSNLQNVTVTATTGFGAQTRSVNSQRVSIVGGVPAIHRSDMRCWDSVTGVNVIAGSAFNCSVNLGDRFGNYADPSQVNFLVEAGLITANATSNSTGLASVSGYRLDPPFGQPYYWGPARPENGLVSTIAFTRGEEYFYDRNSNGVLDMNGGGTYDKCPSSGNNLCYNNPTDGGVVAYDCYCDIKEPFVDKNDNTLFDPAIAEEFRDAPPEDGGFDLGNNKWDNDTLIWFEQKMLFLYGPIGAEAFKKTAASCEASSKSSNFGLLSQNTTMTICVRYTDGYLNCAGVGGTIAIASDVADVATLGIVGSAENPYVGESRDYCFSAFSQNPAKLPYFEFLMKNKHVTAAGDTAKDVTLTISRTGGNLAGGPTIFLFGQAMVAP